MGRLGSSMGAEVGGAGGGIVGSCAALSLARLPCMASSQVILLESSPPPCVSERQEGVFSNRVWALNPAAVTQLEGLGCWRGELQERAQPVSRMQVWDACSSAGVSERQGGVFSNRVWALNPAAVAQLEGLGCWRGEEGG